MRWYDQLGFKKCNHFSFIFSAGPWGVDGADTQDHPGQPIENEDKKFVPSYMKYPPPPTYYYKSSDSGSTTTTAAATYHDKSQSSADHVSASRGRQQSDTRVSSEDGKSYSQIQT